MDRKDSIKNLTGKAPLYLMHILPIVYFLVLLRFYLLDYYVPDFRLYSEWPLADYAAKDGYSSLWIQICGLINFAPRAMTVLCLLLLTASLFFMSKAAYNILFEDSRTKFGFSLVIIYTASIWFYFYGKIFYDFPFAAFVYGILFYIVSLMCKEYGVARACRRMCAGGVEWYVVCFLSGLLLSFKMYNIFAIAGLGLLFLSKSESRYFFVKEILHCKSMILSILIALAGYVAGNYYIVIYPLETLKGINGGGPGDDFVKFLLFKSRVLWDHVSDFSFNIATYCIISAVIILLIIPILNRRWVYTVVSVFMICCMIFFVNNFSTGYCWHGFAFGLFIITYAVYILSEIDLEKINRCLLSVAIICQSVLCFVYYIPQQVNWFDMTEDGIEELESNNYDIYNNIVGLISQFEGTFTIDVAIKRYKPIPVSQTGINVPFVSEHRYFTANNYAFLNPLEATDYYAWRVIEESDRYTGNNGMRMPDVDYIIYVIPNSFMCMSDVANIHKYDESNVVQEIYENEYAIYLIDNSDD